MLAEKLKILVNRRRGGEGEPVQIEQKSNTCSKSNNRILLLSRFQTDQNICSKHKSCSADRTWQITSTSL